MPTDSKRTSSTPATSTIASGGTSPSWTGGLTTEGTTATVTAGNEPTGTNPSAAGEVPWFVRGTLQVPAPVDEALAQQRRWLSYEESRLFSLATAPDERDVTEARAVAMGWNPTLLGAISRSFVQAPNLFDPTRQRIIKQLIEDEARLKDNQQAHEVLGRQYADTRTLRKSLLVRLLRQDVDHIREQAEAALREGRPDPTLMDIYERLTTALQAQKDDKADTQSRTDKAFAKGQEAARAGAQEKEDENRYLRAQVERLTLELQQHQKPTPPAPPTDPRRQVNR